MFSEAMELAGSRSPAPEMTAGDDKAPSACSFANRSMNDRANPTTTEPWPPRPCPIESTAKSP